MGNVVPEVNAIHFSPLIESHAVVFLDRDGIINIDHGYTHQVDQFEFSDGIIAACKRWQTKGYGLIIITNQSGIGRGYYSDSDFTILTEWMVGQFNAHHVTINAVYYCPHTPEEGCLCRKPSPGMINAAITHYHLSPANCWMIGDKESDITAAQAAGILNTILVGPPSLKSVNSHHVRNVIDITII